MIDDEGVPRTENGKVDRVVLTKIVVAAMAEMVEEADERIEHRVSELKRDYESRLRFIAHEGKSIASQVGAYLPPKSAQTFKLVMDAVRELNPDLKASPPKTGGE